MAAGRPTLYQDSYPDQARRLALLGMTDAEMAEFFGVSHTTIYEWDKAHPEFAESRARGKANADAKVAEKLYHRALGYHHPDTHISTYLGEVTETPIVKHYPPDTQAASWWLKNRQPAKWKDKSDIEHTVRMPASAASDDALAAIALSGGGPPAPSPGDPDEPGGVVR